MKTAIMKFKKHFTLSLLLVFVGLATSLSAKKVDRTKDYNYSYKCKADVKFNLSANSAKVSIIAWDKNEVSIKATLKASAKDEEDLDAFFSKANFEPISSENEVNVKRPFGIKSISSNISPLGQSTKVRFVDGDKLKIQKYEVSYEIRLPSKARMNIRSSYKDVLVQGVSGESVFELYSSDFKADNLGKTSLTLKYGNAEIESMKEGLIKLFEANLDLKKARDINMKSHYSRISITKADQIELTSYEDKIKIGELDQLTANIKYATLNLNKVRRVELTAAYELDAEIQDMSEGKFDNSKYSKYTIGSADEIQMKLSYEDKLTANTLDRLKSDNCKYGKIKILEFGEHLLLKGYETDIQLLNVKQDFSSIRVDGKYMELNLDVQKAAKYGVFANVKYPDFKYDARGFDISKIHESGETLQLEMMKKGLSKDSPMGRVSITGYEVDLVLNEI